MSDFTPGPWTGFLDERDGESAWLIGPSSARPIVAAVGADKDAGLTGATVEANARLIAAAPELLHALREILEDPDAKIFDTDREVGWEAIAKAAPARARMAGAGS